MTAVRRSTRAKKQATSIYDDAKKEVEERDAMSVRVERREKDSDDEDESKQDSDNENGSDEEREEEQNSSEDESSDEEEEDFQPKKKKARPASAEKKTKSQKKVQIKTGREPASSGTTTKTTRTVSGTTHTRRAVQNALTGLGRKVLDSTENADNSLVAALLQSAKAIDSTRHRANDSEDTMFTARLHMIARRVIEEYSQDPNKAQVNLLNLLFRSVGGSKETNLDPDKVQLEDMDDEEWGKVVTDIVDEMRHTTNDRILLCADPDGAQHAQAVASSKDSDTVDASPSSLGVREYRKIYAEFWYVLGTVALTEGIASNIDEEDDDDSLDGNRRHTMSFTTTSRFDAEVVRDLISRVSELVTVGQPDLRAAATIAAFRLGHAILNRTFELKAKLDAATRQFDAASKGKKEGERSKKAESFRLQIDSTKRSLDELEEIVMSSVIQGVFMHRYRDSNMFIRAESLHSLSKMTLQRPDMFLMDKFLKYFGWMAHDKAACVRSASLDGLQAPFKANESGSQIDLKAMGNVVTKFLPRIADCIIDTNLGVQERAMSLALSLLQEAFLDDIEDENMWIQINLQTLDPTTTPSVRRDALYFVMDQLEAFDEEEEQDTKASTKRGRSNDASLAQSSERMIVQRLDSLASWVAHELVDGPVPIDKIRVHLADLIVYSLRDMKEHKNLVTNWAAMLRAIGDDSVAITTAGGQAGERTEVAKQRVLVQMLACAAQAEVEAVAEPGFLSKDVDPDALVEEGGHSRLAKPKKTKGGKKSYSGGMPHEVLSVALLSSLPDLLVKFKGDHAILGSLTMLPRYILPSVFSLPQRKKDFMELVKNLSDIFLEASDETVLQNIALSLVALSRGGHTRASDARLHLERVASSLSERVVELLATEEEEEEEEVGTKRKSPSTSRRSSKRRRSSKDSVSSRSSASSSDSDDDDDDEAGRKSRDAEFAISLCLRRLRILAKRCDLSELLKDDVTGDDSVGITVEELCDAITEGMEKRLKERQVVVDSTSDQEVSKVTIPEIWRFGHDSVHKLVACSVQESLSILLCVTAKKLGLAQQEEGVLMHAEDEDIASEQDVDSDSPVDDKHGVLVRQKQLMALLVLCFEQFLPLDADADFSEAHDSFADAVQTHACQVSGDLRSLFAKEMGDAASPLLRECALSTDRDMSLAGGTIRFIRSKEELLRNNDAEQEDVDLSNQLLLPLSRALAANWKLGNRREAGFTLSHTTGAGPEAAKMMTGFTRTLKRINPVRMLEAQMASLRQAYDNWMDNEPEDVESERPTDEEMAAFEEAERKHAEQFQSIEQLAGRFSSSLGVGKLSDPLLKPPLLHFVRDGVRFAFSNDDDGDELMLGSRLSFLTILSKYANWIRRNKDQREVVRSDLYSMESELRGHEDFHEVHEDDLAALASFRKALGLKESPKETSPRSVATSAHHSVTDYSSDEDEYGTRSVSSGKRRRLSHGGSVCSVRSKMSASVTTQLSPLPEEDETVSDESPMEDESDRPTKRRSAGSRLSMGSTLSAPTTIDERSIHSDESSL